MPSFKWRDNHMVPFLELYKKQECLWNTQCHNYLNTIDREKAYNSLVQELNLPGLTVAEVKSKIKSIRTRYSVELAKINRSVECGAEAEDVYVPRLFWFDDADLFLRSVTGRKSKSSNSQNSATEAAIAMCLKSEEAHQFNETVNNAIVTSVLDKVASPISTNSRKRLAQTSTCLLHNSVLKLPTSSDDNKETANEFDVFCESLAIQLKKMPLNRALICQEKLQAVMTQERLSQIQCQDGFQVE